jgi:hypothetical protein
VCKSHDHVGCADPFDPIRAKKDGHLKECNHELFAGKQGGSIPPQNATFFCRKGYQNGLYISRYLSNTIKHRGGGRERKVTIIQL